MASISSLMSSGSSSSIYGSRNSNIISGLASGMDTEAMIEGMVQGYQQKITQLGQDRTMLQWQQSAYQSISDKLVEFSRKYMSYNSPATNLFSASFFNNAILTSANGTYADLVSATGKSSSTIVLNAVAQLAEAARYTHDASGLDTSLGKGEPVKLGEKQPLSTMSGSLTLEYGNKKVTLDFGELELFNKADGTLDTAKFQTALQDKLKEQKITTSSGDQVSADTLIDVKVDSNGTVTLSDKKGAGNNVHFSGATGDLKNLVTSADAEGTSSFTLSTTEKVVKEDATKAEYLSGKSFTVTLNGQTKTFTLGEIDPSKGNLHEQVKQNLQEGLDKAFGKGKITVDMDTTGPGERSFSFSVSNGDTFRITSPVGEVLGLGENGVTSYVDTGKTLGDLLGPCLFAVMMGIARTLYGVKGQKINMHKTLVFSSVMCILSFAITALVPVPAIALIGCSLCGLSVSLMWPGMLSLTAAGYPSGGTAMFALMALGGDLGCSIGPQLTGIIADQSSLNLGLLAAVVFPAVMLIGLMVLKPMLFPKHGADSPQQ